MAENEVRCFLRLRCRQHNEHLVLLQPVKPALEIRGGIINRPLDNPGLAAQKRGAHFGNQFLFAAGIGTEAAVFGERGPFQPGFMAGGMNQLVEQGGVVVLFTPAQFPRRFLSILPSNDPEANLCASNAVRSVTKDDGKGSTAAITLLPCLIRSCHQRLHRCFQARRICDVQHRRRFINSLHESAQGRARSEFDEPCVALRQ